MQSAKATKGTSGSHDRGKPPPTGSPYRSKLADSQRRASTFGIAGGRVRVQSVLLARGRKQGEIRPRRDRPRSGWRSEKRRSAGPISGRQARHPPRLHRLTRVRGDVTGENRLRQISGSPADYGGRLDKMESRKGEDSGWRATGGSWRASKPEWSAQSTAPNGLHNSTRTRKRTALKGEGYPRGPLSRGLGMIPGAAADGMPRDHQASST